MKMPKFISSMSLAAFVFASLSASATDLLVTVQDQNTQPIKHAVVTLTPNENISLPVSDTNHLMKQENMLFQPFVLSVSVGDTVSFPNLDEFRHHVYSFSKSKTFELRLYGKDEDKQVAFDAPGAVALGCNIHDNMLAFIYVTEAPLHAVTDDSGMIAFKGLPAGDYSYQIWHPDMKGGKPSDPVSIRVTNAPEKAISATIGLNKFRNKQSSPSQDQYE